MRLTLLATAAFVAGLSLPVEAADTLWLPTGQTVTPEAAPGSSFQPLSVDLPVIGRAEVGGGMASALSPDGHTLFLLTAGYNSFVGPDGKRVDDASTEHLFVYDITGGTPVLKQDVHVPNAYGGLVVGADGKSLYVAGGVDDNLHVFGRNDDGKWVEDGAPVAFGHSAGNGVIKSPLVLKPMAAGTALTSDGKTLLVANYENDSLEIVDVASRKASELDLRPGKIDPKDKGVPGGEFPYWIAIRGSDTAYVSSVRDREIDVVALAPAPHVASRIKVPGNPNRLLLDKAGARLFVATDNSDRVLVIDTATNAITASIAAGVPDGYGANTALPGASPNSLALSPDEKTLYVTEGGINALGIIGLDGAPRLEGLVPTAWEPSSVSVSPDGRTLYVANGKSPAGPDPRMCAYAATKTPVCGEMEMKHVPNQYVWQHTTGGLASIPVPDADTLKRLTAEVADNNGYREVESADDARLMAGLRKRIKHVIYIVRENRTYDQILGDLPGTDGDPSLVQFGPDITANAHAIAKQFVALDSFFDSGEASGNGWNWSTAARTTDVIEKEMPVNYADRGLTYDFEGTTRDINVSLPTAERLKANPLQDTDPDLLPGSANQAAPDGPDGEQEQGYLWDAALRAHQPIRNYGFFLDIVLYDEHVPEASRTPLELDPAAKHLVVAIPANHDLADVTDPYFRGFDNMFPDLYRYREWNREFTAYEKKGTLPALETVRFMHDHTGSFKTALFGVNTPERQVADNDYAVGLLIARVAHSKFANSTLVFVIEDDAQDGPDHVDAHRSVAFIAGPYVKHGAVVSERYTTVNMLKTIEELLGLKPLNFHDGNARAMTAAFDLKAAHWSYDAVVPAMLRTTSLPLPPEKRADARPVRPLHEAAWWAAKTKGFDFSSEDKVDPVAYDRILWEGTKGNVPYPTRRDGRNDRHRTASAANELP